MGRTVLGARLRVYVMLGEVLAAHADDDDERILALLRAVGHVPDAQHVALKARIAAGKPLAEVLFDALPDEPLMEALFERFRENLFQFLSAVEVLAFQPMEAVFTENIQVGHDSRALIAELLALRERVAWLAADGSLLFGPGNTAPTTPQQLRVLTACGGGAGIDAIVARSPWEPARVLDLVDSMLERGMLERVEPPASGPDDPLPDEETAEANLPPAAAPPARQAREASWPEEGADDDLAAFQDYDTSRGDDGAFLSDRTLLDRVELGKAEGAPSLAASTETVIEMEDAEGKDALRSAVSLNFAGPKLHDQEVKRKLEVINEVLATVAQAIERAEGPGAGQARLQLLVEGTQVTMAPLFKGIELSAEGRLPIALVVKNLRKRPAGEHRRLLNRGLSDLIERALSSADEVLDEQGLEGMLEQIAGYQQRMGI